MQAVGGDKRLLRWGTLGLAVLVVALAGKSSSFGPDLKTGAVVLLGLAKVSLALCLWWLFHSMGVLVRALVRREPHPVLSNPGLPLSFVLFAGYFGFWLYGLWPGLIVSDTYGFLQMVEGLSIHAWYSYLHTFLYLMLFQLYPHVGVVGVFQVLLAAGVFAWVGGFLFERSRAAWGLYVLVLGVSLPIVANVLSYHVDILFSLLYIGVAFFVFRTVLREGESGVRLEGRAAWRLSGVIAVLAAYRGEALFLIPLVPLVLWVNRCASRKTLVTIAAASLGLFLVLSVPLAQVVYALSGTTAVVNQQKNGYALTLRLNPLGYILQRPHFSRDTTTDTLDLSPVVDVEKVMALSIPYETPVYWAGGWNPQMTDEDFQRFNKRVRRLELDNLPLFLSGRLLTFLSSTGLADHASFYFTDYARRDMGARAMCPQRCLDSVPEAPLSQPLYEKMMGLLDDSITFHGAELRGSFLHWNLLPALLWVMLALALYPRLPATAAASFIVFARVPVVVLAAPASQFKYYLSLYLFGLLVPFLGFIELRVRARRRAGDTRAQA